MLFVILSILASLIRCEIIANDFNKLCTDCHVVVRKFYAALENNDKNFESVIQEISSSLDENRLKILNIIKSKLEDDLLNTQNTSISDTKIGIARLCVPNFCCPAKHFGQKCLPCSDCNPNGGVCDGSGTISGTGSCRCKPGYSGPSCNACLKNTFQSLVDNNILCSTCNAACGSGCSNAGPDFCLESCAPGFEEVFRNGSNLSCKDINECSLSNPCHHLHSFCQNEYGSFNCKKCHKTCIGCTGEGPNNCKKCKDGYQMIENKCVDIDECLDDQICSEENEFCQNQIGSYQCVCRTGYQRVEDHCIPVPNTQNINNKRKSEKVKIIWTVTFFLEFCKLLASLFVLALVCRATKGNILSVGLSSFLVSVFLCYCSTNLDKIYNAQL